MTEQQEKQQANGRRCLSHRCIRTDATNWLLSKKQWRQQHEQRTRTPSNKTNMKNQAKQYVKRYTLNDKTTRCIIMARPRVFYIHRYRYMPMHASIDAYIRRAYGHAIANFRLHKKQIECETVRCRSVLTLWCLRSAANCLVTGASATRIDRPQPR